MKSIVNVDQEIYDYQSVQRLFRRNFAPDEPTCFERFNWSSQHRWSRQRFLGRCFRGSNKVKNKRMKLKRSLPESKINRIWRLKKKKNRSAKPKADETHRKCHQVDIRSLKKQSRDGRQRGTGQGCKHQDWRDSGAVNDKSRTHFVLNGRKCCRDVRGFCKFRRGHGNDELVQRKYFRTEEKYRSFQDLIKFFQHSAFCRVFLL